MQGETQLFSGYEERMKMQMADITPRAGEPAPFEIERKFLIAYPDIGWLQRNPACCRAEIVQTYLRSGDGDEIRVRQREENGQCTYYKTIKRRVSDIKRIEIENQISFEEYQACLMDADPAKRQICKTRYCLTHERQCFEIDVYPFWSDRAIMEIELTDENAEIAFPKEIRIIREVTGEKAYKNAALAEML